MEEEKAREYQELVKLFSKVEVNVPLLTMIKQIPKYAKFLKDLCVHKKKLKGNELISMGKKCFSVTSASSSEPTGVVIQLANRSQAHPAGVIEDVLVKVRELIFPADFYILDMEGDLLANWVPLILGRPFLKTARTKIDMHAGTLSMEIGDTVVRFSIFEAMKHSKEDHSILSVDISEELDGMEFLSDVDSDLEVSDFGQENEFVSLLEDILDVEEDANSRECVGDCLGEALPLGSLREEEICVGDCLAALPPGSPTIDQTQEELKSLSQHLKYVYLGENKQLPVVIAQNLELDQEERLLEILRQHRKAIRWTLADILGISHSICMHRIHLEEDADIIYPIFDSKWVSPIHVVSKKSGVTVVANEENELVPTRIKNSWRVCVDYRKLNQASRKDHYPLPFIDQMLERLTEDQEKTTFTCPFGTFTYCRMSFGLCNTPVSRKGIEVDPAKVSAISSLSYPVCVQEVRAFLGHAGFYRRFIRDFSKIALPLSQLLQKDVMFDFDQRCIEAFDRLKETLTSAPIIRPPDWSLSFELMCDASDYAMRVVLAQRVDGAPHVICYASKTLDSAQANYTTTEKELLSIIHDRSGNENLVADHLSRIEGDLDHSAIDDDFKDEQLLQLLVDYVFKWVEAIPTMTDDSFIVVSFVRHMKALIHKYGVTHKVSTSYHPQTNEQAEVSNREVKSILEKTVRPDRKDWSKRLEDAL
ncbi:uncharacterized protein LOC122036377 [Zingiber officinale]|uniref:uncharacterized protein LOC122036377 n=1 Tax=Zingiber officinale TaxID=94328 RepID=UPI001C4AB50E|nr:uncharacterized protein LOC122036377 [Zingiber officinale]